MPRKPGLGISKAERVTQSNDLARAAQDLDLNEKRLILYTISRIKRSDTQLLRHRFYRADLVTIFGQNRHDIYKLADDVTTKLLERVLYIETTTGWKKFQWASLAEYVDGQSSKDGAYIEIKLNEELEPYLIDLSERFNNVPLGDLLRIPSFNSLRLFEMIWHDSHGGKNTVVEYDLGDLKIRLGLCDINGRWEKYKTYKDFRYVLDKAREDINGKTSLQVHYKPVRAGRRYEKLRFVVDRARPSLPEEPRQLEPEEEARRQKLARALEHAGFTQNPFEVIDSHGAEVVERVLRKAKAAERRAEQTNRPIRNLGGLIAWMLKSGVGNTDLEGDDDADNAASLSREQVNNYAATLCDSFASNRAEFLQRFWDNVSPDEQEEILDIMKAVLDRHTLKVLDGANWGGLVFEGARNRVMVERGLVELPAELASIGEFLRAGVDLDLNEEDLKQVFEAAVAMEENW